MASNEVSNKAKAHTQYIGKDGVQVPGVSTVINLLGFNKGALIHWAWKHGMNGVDYRKAKDDLADVGTCVHLMILKHLQNDKLDLSDYSQNVIDRAENSFLSYLEWEKQHTLKPLFIEKPLVSDRYNYGGTPDYIGEVDDYIEVIDFKSGSGLYLDNYIQLAAYHQLAIEQGITPTNNRLLRIPRTQDEGFDQQMRKRLVLEFEMFYYALQIYYLQKELKRG